MQVGSLQCEHLGEWVGSARLRSLYIYTFIYLFICTHTYLYLCTDRCSISADIWNICIYWNIYISVKAGGLQKLTLKNFYINTSQCLPNFVGLQALRETVVSSHKKSYFCSPNAHEGWMSVPSEEDTGRGVSPTHLRLFAFISLLFCFLRAAGHGSLKETPCLLSGHAGDKV